MGKKKENVFCKECKHIQINDSSNKVITHCVYPLNIKFSSNWYDRQIYKKYKKYPYQLNKRNNCKWYSKNCKSIKTGDSKNGKEKT